MARITCPMCWNSHVLCSACDGRGTVENDGPYDWADFTETSEDHARVRREQSKAKRRAL